MRSLALFLLAPACAVALSYEVNFVGLKDDAALRALGDASDLVSLKERPPASLNGLRYRIASDIPALLKVLRAFAYYEASITWEVESEGEEVQVYLFIHPGPQYKLSSYEVYSGTCEQLAEIPLCCPLTPEQLGLKIGNPALSVDIVNAELQILTELTRCGYPLAWIDKRSVAIDMADQTVHAAACVQEGPFSKFGPTSIFGLKGIDPRFIVRRIAWKEGEVYDSDSVEETQRRLLKTDLFSSVMVSHGDALDILGELPMKMRIVEAKHQQIGFGIFYATINGPGLTFAWTHRNVGGFGEILSARGDFSRRYLMGNITYKKPDFLTFDQTYRALVEVRREKIRPYLSFIYRFANYIERVIDPQRTISAGLKIEHIDISKSATDGTYLLLGLPLFGRYNTSDSVLDPTTGYTITYSITPYQSLQEANRRFAKQRLTGIFYIPLFPKKVILALRIQMGSIAGARQPDVPLTKLFLGGSEDDLRGYRYQTVSPLNIDRKPLGGRSAIFATVEMRWRMMQKIGIVPFADFGTVSFSEIPQFDEKWFKSVGIGLRYYAFFGPLRVDVGFPLDRRKGIDPAFQIYASVGQAF